jgi:hypothetical protein
MYNIITILLLLNVAHSAWCILYNIYIYTCIEITYNGWADCIIYLWDHNSLRKILPNINWGCRYDNFKRRTSYIYIYIYIIHSPTRIYIRIWRGLKSISCTRYIPFIIQPVYLHSNIRIYLLLLPIYNTESREI